MRWRCVVKPIGSKHIDNEIVFDGDPDDFLRGAIVAIGALTGRVWRSKNHNERSKEVFFEHPVSGKKMLLKVIPHQDAR